MEEIFIITMKITQNKFKITKKIKEYKASLLIQQMNYLDSLKKLEELCIVNVIEPVPEQKFESEGDWQKLFFILHPLDRYTD